MWVRRIVAITVIFVAGAILGPVAIAAIAAARQPADTSDTGWEARRLIDAYQARLPQYLLFTTIIPPGDGTECGYDPAKIFPDSIQEMAEGARRREFTAYQGYYVLHRWAGQMKDEAYLAAIGVAIDKEMSGFKQGFLRRCIESTLFAPICMREVEKFGDKVERFPEPPREYQLTGGHEQDIVCGYVDGIAARRGVPLAKKPG